MIAMGPNPVRRQRLIACLSVAVASLLSASGTVMTERLTGRGLSELLANAIRPQSDPPAVAGTTQDAAGATGAPQAPGVPNAAGGQVAAGGGSPAMLTTAGTPGGAGSAARPATKGAGARPAPSTGTAGSGSATTGGPGTAGGSTGTGGSPGGGTVTPGADPGAPTRHPLEQEVDALKPFVEREAGLAFAGPVAVRIVSDSDFRARLAALNWLPKGEDAERLEGVYRSLGIFGADVDLATELAKFTRNDVSTLYDAVAGELLIRDQGATPYLRTMLVRELTRALNDQHFDIYRPGGDAADESRDGLKALAEGDATRVYDRYVAAMASGDRASADAERDRIARQTPTDINQSVLVRFTYAINRGIQLVSKLLASGGRARLDAAFRSPPSTSEQILTPELFLAGEGAKAVAEPPADGPVVTRGRLGQIGLLLMLTAGTDNATGARAADGWGGDSYVSWRDGTRTCTRLTVLADTAQDTTELGTALGRWSQSRSGAELSGTGPFTVKRCA